MCFRQLTSCLILVIFLTNTVISPVSANEDTQQNFNSAQPYINSVHTVNPSLPTNVPEQKGRIGELLSRLFIRTGSDQGKIGNWFLKVLGSREDGRILRWVGDEGGKLETGSIYDNGTEISIGGPIVSGTTFNVEGDSIFDGDTNVTGNTTIAGDINVLGDILDNGNPFTAGGKFVDGANTDDAVYTLGNVGIGTNTPVGKFQVSGNNSDNIIGFDGLDAALRIVNFSNGNWIQSGTDYTSGSAADLRFSTINGTQTHAIITGSGNVGIGTAIPDEKLSVSGDGSWELGLTTVDGIGRGASANDDGLLTVDGDLLFQVDDNNNQAGAFRFYNGTEGEIFTINESGNVVATGNVIASEPTAPNHLTTKSYVDSLSASGTVIEQNIADDIDTNYVPRDDGTKLVTGTIYDDGTNIGIGTSTPGQKFVVNDGWANYRIGEAPDYGFGIQLPGSGNTGWGRGLSVLDSTGARQMSVDFYGSLVSGVNTNTGIAFNSNISSGGLSDAEMIIDADGSVGIGTTTPSERLEVDGNIIANDPILATHVATKNYVDTQLSGGNIDIDDLGDAKTDTTSVFLGDGSGANDDGNNSNTAVGRNALDANTSGVRNVALGYNALTGNTTANNNIALGYNSLAANTTGTQNTAIGSSTLSANTSGIRNVALGYNALTGNTTASNNIALGTSALSANTTGAQNTAIGGYSLDANTTGTYNTAIGFNALTANTTASYNLAIGGLSLDVNTIGRHNLGIGYNTLGSNTTASNNIALGYNSLAANTTGAQNTAIGALALDANTTGIYNTAIGYNSLSANTASFNTAIGGLSLDANTTGIYNVGIGYSTLTSNTTASNNIALGFNSLGANTIGTQNIAIGSFVLDANTTANHNVGIGYNALSTNTTGAQNIAMGSLTLDANTTGIYNLAIGHNALSTNTTANYNTAVGGLTLDASTIGSNNTTLGYAGLSAVTTGNNNTALGYAAGDNITTGSSNIIIGSSVDAPSASGSNQLNIGNTIYGNLANGNVGIGGSSYTATDESGSVNTGLRVSAGPTSTGDVEVARFTGGSDADNTAGVVRINAGNDRGLYLKGGRRSGNTSFAELGIIDTDGTFETPSLAFSDNGNVGIGTVSPATKLHLAGSPALNDTSEQSLLRLERPFNGGVSFAQGVDLAVGRGNTYPSTQLAFKLDNGSNNPSNPQVEVMTLDSGGNVGIGTSTPDVDLEVSAPNPGGPGAKTDWPELRITSETNGTYNRGDIHGRLSFYTDDTSGNFPGISSAIDATTTRSDGITNPDTGLSFKVTNSSAVLEEVMMIEGHTRNVGIGTTIPDEKLSVSGDGSWELGLTTVDGIGRGTSANDDGLLTVDGDLLFQVDDNNNQTGAFRFYDGTENQIFAINESGSVAAIGTVSGAEPTASNHLTTKNYVDTLVTAGVSWKAPVPNGSTPTATHGACNASREGWATYNSSDNVIYLCNASAWVNIGSTAVIPNATTTTPGKVQLTGDIGGTWNNLTLRSNTVDSGNIVNSTITASDLAANSVGTSEVINDSLTNADIAAGAIGSSELGTNAVSTTKIADNSITASDLAPNSVGNSELIDIPTFTRLVMGTNNAGTTPDIDLSANAVLATENNLYLIADSDNNSGSEGVVFGTNANGTTGMTEHMRISGNGNVGIGTSTPEATLDIDTNGSPAGPGGWNIATKYTNGSHNALWNPTGGLLFGMHSNGRFYFGDESAGVFEKYVMTINSDTGNVGIGTADTTAAKLAVNGTVSASTPTASSHLATKGYVDGQLGTVSINDLTDGRTVGTHNYGLGVNALINTTGANNVGLGRDTLETNTTGAQNVAIGSYALEANTTATYNTAIGHAALRANTTGVQNTAIGGFSLDANTTGIYNLGIGYNTLSSNTTASNNIALGYNSLAANTTGTQNVAIGSLVLDANTTANNNVGIGYNALSTNTTGAQNIAMGSVALDHNTTGIYNVAIGHNSLTANTTANYNTAVGGLTLDASTTASNNTTLGYAGLSAVTTGNNNTALGYAAGDNLTTGSSNIIIGSSVDAPSATASNQLNIGNTIYGNLANGNVGIGTSSPSEKLDVRGVTRGGISTATIGQTLFEGRYTSADTLNIWGSQRSTGANVFGYAIRPKDGAAGFASAAGNSAFAKSVLVQGGDLTFSTSPAAIVAVGADITPTERFRITNAGNVGIGISNPSQRLHVSAITRSDGGFQVDGTTVIGGDAWVEGDRIRQNTIDSSEIQNDTLTASDLAANSVGNSELIDSPTFTTVNAASYLYTSDKKLKKNIKTYPGLATIMRLRGVSFDWREDNISSIGLIAQEIEGVIPEVVRIDPESGYKSVDYGNLVAPLIEAVKEQQEMIENSQDEIELLKKELELLKGKN